MGNAVEYAAIASMSIRICRRITDAFERRYASRREL